MALTKPIKTATVCAVFFALWFGAPLHGQTITGRWQGTLPARGSQRVVLELAKADSNGSLRGSLIFIDKGATGPPLLSVAFSPPDFTAVVADIHYQGKLSADGKSMSGTWTQGSQSYPLTLVLATPETMWTYTGPAPIAPMAANADPAFEVASVKPSQGNETSIGFKVSRFIAENATVADLIRFAYKVRDRQVDGGPAWMNEDRFDIAAETDTPGQPSRDQQRSMVRKMLANRFGLQVRVDQRQFQVYALTVEHRLPKVAADESPTVYDHGFVNVTDRKDGQTAVQFTHYTMPEFADALMNFIRDRQIVDETGLRGRFDFALLIPTDTAYGRQGPEDMDRATAYFEAVQPLGFKLVKKAAALDVIVISHLEQPAPN
jgi:uncharacterized protein (TIGR03435 family)